MLWFIGIEEHERKRLSLELVHSFPHRGLSWIVLGKILIDQRDEAAQKDKQVPSIPLSPFVLGLFLDI